MNKLIAWLVVILACAICLAAVAAPADPAETLRGRYAALQGELQKNQFDQPVHLDSRESGDSVMGDIHARVDYPFATVKAALSKPEQWCDVMILHLNTKGCRATGSGENAVLTVYIGSKDEQALEDAYPVRFNFKAAAMKPEYFRIELRAEDGPLSTSDYRIMLEAVDVGQNRTFLHLSYAYSYGLAGRLAMKTYLATIGSNKVGFTITGRNADGKPEYIEGVRGVIERNTMRYYLAIDAYLSALAASPSQQLEQRLRHWYNATEQYPRQLHEVEREAYMAMKRKEYHRQNSKP
jgi:hypothetical protein